MAWQLVVFKVIIINCKSKNENPADLSLIYRKGNDMEIFRAIGINKKEYISFIAEYKPVMYRIAYGYLGDETRSLDAVDEAVYLGYLNRKKLREPRFLKTWLTRILINECYRILIISKREVIMEEMPEEMNPPIDDDSIPIKFAVQSLPEDLRKIIVLRYFGGYTIAETAVILEIPEGTVATRTRKAMGILRVELDDEEGGETHVR